MLTAPVDLHNIREYGRVMVVKTAGARRTPIRLSVDLLRVDDEEYAVFEWGTDAPAAELTAAERSVLEHLVAGASNADIARARGAAIRTVANQVAALLRKLGAGSRYDLIARHGRHRAGPRAP